MPKPQAKKAALRFPMIMWVFIILTLLTVLTFPRWIGLFYPVPHKDIVIKYSDEFGIDPLLVFSLIKVESHFSPEAKSASGAQGLMQLMPETARWAAHQLQLKDFDDTKLSDPEVNIQLGCWYISDLSREFNGRVPLIIAAYNAGRGNVREWLIADIWDGTTDHLEGIPFPETRIHVKKVLNEYEIYRLIYKDADKLRKE